MSSQSKLAIAALVSILVALLATSETAMAKSKSKVTTQPFVFVKLVDKSTP